MCTWLSVSSRAKRSSTFRPAWRSILLSVVAFGMALAALGAQAREQGEHAQALFVGDTGDNSVKQFQASGNYVGSFVASGAAGLDGPRGMIFTDGQLIVVNQNVDASNTAGEILRFDGKTGLYLGKLVASSDRNAPFGPRGIVRGGPGSRFFVADMVGKASACAAGNVKEYNENGAFVNSLVPDPRVFTSAFHPRGVVFGPDGLLYVSASGCLDNNDPLFDPLAGYIVRFNAINHKFVDIFASNATLPDLHRPEGLVFDSEGNLWVTSFRAGGSDTDKILKLDGKTGALRDELVLDSVGGARTYAQAIIFGPGGYLYVPVAGSDPKTTGEVQRCNPKTKACDIFVHANSAGGSLISPWYLIFENSDPATLNYDGD